MTKSVIIWICVFGVTFAALFLLIKYAGPTDPSQVIPEINTVRPEDRTKGNPQAKAILVEYGDYQCPACAQYEPLVQQLYKDMGDKVLIIFRNFPLTQHPHALTAARFAEAAGIQGKFWEMHELIYQGQDDWKDLNDAAPKYLEYASSLNLDTAKLQQDINSEAVKRKIELDIADTDKYDLRSTPTFFLNGKRIQFTEYDKFKKLVEDAAGS